MKLTILLLFLAIAGYGQREITGSGISVSTSDNKQDPNMLTITYSPTLQDYIKAYEADCNTMVLDTVDKCGTIEYNYIPVYEGDKLLLLKAMPVDTVWKKPYTKEYKHESIGLSYISNNWLSGTITITGEGYILNEQQTEVCVDYIYETKKREPVPFGMDFWNFVKNYKQ